MVTLDELDDDAWVCASHMLGAPTVLVEKVPNGREGVCAVDALEARLGRKFDAIMPLEAGGLNSLLPFQVAAAKGVPIVDADGMGRAFPELRHVTWTLFDVPACPAAVCDEKGDTVVVEAVDNEWAERLARNVAITTGGSVFMADYAMTGAQAKKTSILERRRIAKSWAVRDSRGARGRRQPHSCDLGPARGQGSFPREAR